MADFQTHIGASTITGIGYAVWGYNQGVPLETAALGAGLCSVSGMLPDLDSDSGVPHRESFAFLAAIVPALMIDRFQHLGWANETIAIATGAIYLLIRFPLAAFFRNYTVHRGMWHSVPACGIAGLVTFLLVSRDDFMLRVFLAFAVMLGFFSHLLLDEIWSLQIAGSGGVGLKKSWGTALKFWSDSAWANFVTWGKLILFGTIAAGDPMLMERYQYTVPFNTRNIAEDLDEFADKAGHAITNRWGLDDDADQHPGISHEDHVSPSKIARPPAPIRQPSAPPSQRRR